MVLASIIKRFFSLLSFPGDPEAARKRSLASLVKAISSAGPHWYDPWSDRLTQDLATALERITGAAARADAVFTHTVLGDAKTQERVADALIDRALMNDGNSLAALGFSSLRQDAFAGNPPDPLAAMDALFHERLGALNSLSVTGTVSGYKSNLRLASFCRCRFGDIIAEFASPKAKTKPRSMLPAAGLLHYLEDLYFLVAGLHTRAETKSVFLALAELSGQPDYPPERIVSDLRQILDTINGPVRETWLLNVIRIIHSDPAFEPAVDTAEHDIRKAVSERLQAEYSRRRVALEEGLRAEALDAMIAKLFGEAILPPLCGWTEEESETLIGAGLQGLANIKSLSVLKSFLLFRYSSRIRPAISDAVVELDFADIDFRRSLSDAADALDVLKLELEAFEASITIPGQNEYARYILALRDGSLEASGLRSAGRWVESIKTRADGLVQQAFLGLGELSVHLIALKDDVHSRDSRIMYRIPAADRRRHDILNNLEEAADEIVALQDLLRMLAVDKDRTKRVINLAAQERQTIGS